MTQEQRFQPTRRQVTAGMAWAVPAITVASQAPAFAASFPSGCYVPNWPGATSTATTITVPTTHELTGAAGPTLTITSTMNSGNAAPSNLAVQQSTADTNPRATPPPNTSTFKYYIDTSDSGTGATSASNPSQPGFQLSQYSSRSSRASQTLTFSLGGSVISSVAFRVYDLTADTVNSAGYRYIDNLTLLNGTTGSFTAVGTSCPLTTTTTSVQRSGDCQSSEVSNAAGASDRNVDVNVTGINSANFQFTYSNTGTGPTNALTLNWQYTVIGRLQICV